MTGTRSAAFLAASAAIAAGLLLAGLLVRIFLEREHRPWIADYTARPTAPAPAPSAADVSALLAEARRITGAPG
jgi:hypothetical protein